MEVLRDTYGRTFTYLRLSITEACNFRCQYCLPHGYQRTISTEPYNSEFLSIAEIKNLVGGLIDLGVRKIRLTGGEPTLRPDIVPIVETVSSFPEITSIGLTTNGYRLKELAPKLKQAGITSLNVSLDSLDQKRFRTLTGSKLFDRVRAGVDVALETGFRSVKLNAVILRSGTFDELGDFLRLIERTPISVRFIELMRTGENEDYFNTERLSSTLIQSTLESLGWVAAERRADDGPAREFTHPSYIGRIGLIAPYSKDFCRDCNRLRITARGALKLCLFGNGQASLRNLLQSDSQRSDLSRTVIELVQGKPAAHRLSMGDYGSTQHLASIGG